MVTFPSSVAHYAKDELGSGKALTTLKIAFVLVRFDQFSRRITNVGHNTMRTAAVFCVVDGSCNFQVPQAAKRQHVPQCPIKTRALATVRAAATRILPHSRHLLFGSPRADSSPSGNPTDTTNAPLRCSRTPAFSSGTS